MVSAFLDFYAMERGWQPLKNSIEEIAALKGAIRRHLFPRTSKKQVVALLRERRFVILQGPPGRVRVVWPMRFGPSTSPIEVRRYSFIPAVTYESFVAGISPDVTARHAPVQGQVRLAGSRQ